MGFLWFLGGFLAAILLTVGAYDVFCAGMAAADKKKRKPEATDIEVYNDAEVK